MADLASLASNPFTRLTTRYFLRAGLRRQLGRRAPLFAAPIVREERRPGWFWILIDQRWVLTRELSDQEIAHRSRPEPVGFAVARVLTRIQALEQFGRILP